MKIEFNTFIMSLASTAYCSLGLAPNPITNKTEKNLEVARGQIDLIEMLKEKTKGNLKEDETQLIDSILNQLQMIYVEEVNKKENKGNENEEKKDKEAKEDTKVINKEDTKDKK
jgi:hypothetical protein